MGPKKAEKMSYLFTRDFDWIIFFLLVFF
jgi:hypothetical protein